MLLRDRIFSLAFLSFLILLGTKNAQAQCPTFSGATYIPTLNQICATTTLQPDYDVVYGINFLTNVTAGFSVRARYDWGDGNITYHNFGVADGSTKDFVAPSQNKVYPPAPGPCEYEVRFTIQIDNGGGYSNCPGTRIEDQFASWELDNTNGGVIQLTSPFTGTNDEPVCEGVDVNSVFDNTSSFNCQDQGGGVPKIPNEAFRWEQFVYNTGGVAVKIPNAFLGATQLTGAGGADVNADVEDPRGVIMLPPPATDASPKRTTLPITAVGGFGAGFPQIGDQIEVTLRMWNFCNPYSNNYDMIPVGGDFVLGDNAPLESVATVTIVGAPAPPNVPTSPFCETDNNNAFDLTATGVGAPPLTYTWYKDAALSIVLQGPNADNTFNPVTEGPAVHRINKTVAGSTTFHRYVTVTQANTCTSDTTDIFIQIDDTNIPGAISHPLGATPNAICSGDDPAAFTSISPGTGGGPGGTFAYQWQQANASGGPYSNIGGATAATFDPSAADIAAGRFFRRRLRSGECNRVLSNVMEFTIDTPVLGGSIGNAQTLCTGSDPGTITNTVSPTGGNGSYGYLWQEAVAIGGPYNPAAGTNNLITYDPPVLATTMFYRRLVTSGVCAPGSALSNVIEITMNQLVVPGSIGNAQTICEDDNPAVLTETGVPGGGDGVIYIFTWEESATGGGVGFGPAAGVNNGNTYDPPVLTSTLFYRRRVSSGVCANTFSNEIEVTVNALPTADVGGGGSICGANPAPDVVFTFTGNGPWTLVYAIDGFDQAPIVVASPHAITTPGLGVYTITSVQDSNAPTCTITAPHANITGSASVVNSATPPPTVDGWTVTAEVCDDGAGTNPPDALLDLQPDAVANYDITYSVNGFVHVENNKASDGAGVLTLSPPYTDWGSVPGSYVVTVTALKNTLTGCAAAVPFDSPLLVVNPRPAVPTNPIDAIACSTDPTGATLVVDDPGVGNLIQWFTDAPGTIPAVGVTSGIRQEQFNPTSTATVTYHAFAESTILPTLCKSPSGTIVEHTQDLEPTAAADFPDFSTCNTSDMLSATPADNFATGLWTVGAAVYYESFPSADNGLGIRDPNPHAISFTHPNNNWTVTVPNANVFTSTNDWIMVDNGRMSARDVNNNEVVWESELINLTGSVDISADIAETGNQGVGDYIRVYYKINGGAEVPFGAINDDGTDGVFQTVTATGIGLAGNTLEIVMRARNNGVADEHWLNNVIVSAAGSVLPTFDDANSPTATVSNLPIGITTFTWTITSLYGACAITNDMVAITRHALPVAIDPLPELCEDSPGTADATVTPAYLITLDNTVNGGNPLHTVLYYPTAARTPGTEIAAPFVVNTNDKIYTVVTRTDVAPQCTFDGEVTFTVDPRPEANDQVYLVCEQTVGSANVDDQNLIVLFNDDAIGNPPVAPGDRNVTWYFDPGAPITIAEDLLPFPGSIIPDPTDVDGIVDGQLFYALIENNTTATNCLNFAQIEYDVRPRPIANPIVGQPTVCASGATILYQVTTIIPGTQYVWTLPPDNPGFFQVFGGGTINDFFVLLQFPGLTAAPAPDVYNISVAEISPAPDLCVGDPQNFVITVEDSPSPNPIIGPDPVCKDEKGVVYQVTTNNPANTYSWSISAGDAAIVGASNGVGLNQVIVDFNSAALVTLEVIETSPTGCSLPAAQTININAVDPPVMTSAFNYSLCSGEAPATAPVPFVFTAAPGANNFAWEAVSVPGSVTGVLLNEMGVGDINKQLFNTSGLDAIVTFEVTPTGVAAPMCVGPVQTVFVTVQPEPILLVGQNTAVCGGSSIAYEILLAPANLPAGTVFNWPDPDGAGPASDGVNVAMGVVGTTHINDIIPNTTGVPINITYVVTPTSGSGCDGVPQNIDVTIDPQPIIVAAQTKTICGGDNVDYHVDLLPASLPANTEYSWAAPIMSAGGPQGSAGVNVPEANALTITDVLTNSTGAAITATYIITPTVNGGANCTTLPPVDVVITVEPVPAISPGQIKTICSGDNVDYHVDLLVAGLPVNTEYSWAVPTMSAGPAQGTAGVAVPESNALTITDALTNTTGAAITATYSITASVNGGLNCTALAPVDVVITIEPQPIIAAAQTKTICSGSGVDYHVDLLPAGLPLNTVFNWAAPTMSAGPAQGSAGVNVPESNALTITDVLTNTTGADITATYSITPIVGSGLNCTTLPAVDVIITIEPEPIIVAGQIKTICSGENVDYHVNLLPAALPVNTEYSWAAPTMSAGPAQGTAGVAVPESNALTITDAFTNTTGVAITATYSITPTVNGGLNCTTLPPVDVVITIEPIPIIAAGQTMTICSGENVDYHVDLLPAGLPLNTEYDWGMPTMSAGPAQGSAGVSVPEANALTITDVLTNTTGAAITATYSIVPTVNGGANCTTLPAVDVVITIEPEPIIVAGQTKTICSGENVDYHVDLLPAGLPANTEYSWAVPTMSAGPAQGTAGVNVPEANALTITDVLTNTTGADITATYSITPVVNGGLNCTTLPAVDVVITIEAQPIIVAGQIKTICSGDNVDYHVDLLPAGLPVNTEYSWAAPTMSAGPAQGTAGAAVPESNALTITDALTNTTGAAITATYSITPTVNGGLNCTTLPAVDVVITIEAQPIIVAGQIKTICSGDNVDYHVDLLPAGLPANTEYSWAAPTMSAGPAQGTAGVAVPESNALTITDALTNTTGAAITATYSIIPTVNGGLNCTTLPAVDVVITIEPQPVIVAGQTQTICSGDNVDYHVDLIPGALPANTEYSWPAPIMSGGPVQGTAGVAVPESNVFTITESLVNTTGADITATYSITPTVNGGLNCTTLPAVDVVITIEPQPIIVAGQTKTICSGENVDYHVDLLPAGLPANTEFSWAVPTMSAGPAQGTAGVSVPEANALTITDALTNTTGADITATYSITPTVAGGLNCTTLPPVDVVITIEPQPVIVAAQSKTICSGSNVDYHVDLLPAGLPANTEYNWPAPTMSAGAPQGSAGVNVAESNVFTITDVLTNTSGAAITATYSITPTINGGLNCTTLPPVDVIITIEPEPIIIAGQTKTICSGDNIDLHVDLLPAGLPLNTEYSWPVPVMSGGPVQGTAGVAVPESNALTIVEPLVNTTGADITATYSITPTVSTGLNCTTLPPVDVVITIEPQPIIIAGQTKTICSGENVDYHIDLLPAGLPANTEYSWAVPTMSAGPAQGTAGVNVPESNALTITDALTNTTGVDITATYSITPTINGGLNCTTLPAVDVVITIEPQPVIIAGQVKTICSGDNVNYHVNLLTAGLPTNTEYTWPLPVMSAGPAQGTAGVNVPEVNPFTITEILTNTTGASITATYTITPTVSGGLNCTTLPPVDVVITIDPEPVMQSAAAETICSGASPTIALSSNVPGSTFNWIVASVTNVTGTLPGNSGNDLTTEVLNNISGAPGFVSYNVTATGPTALLCPGPIQIVTITVDPAPVMTSANAETICSGNTPSINFSSNVVGSTFDWVVTAVVNVNGTFVGKIGNTDFSGELLTNFASVPGTVTYDVTPRGPIGLGCFGITQIVTITVDPGPAGVADAEEECSNVALNYDIQADNINNGGNNVLGQFSYTVSEITASGIPLEPDRVAASTLPITFTYVNTTAVPAIVRYTITPIGFGACAAGMPFDVDFTINPEPVINPQSVTICSQVPLTVTPAVANFAPGDVTISWIVKSISGAVTGINVNDTDITDPFPHNLVNTSSAPAVITYSFTATANVLNNCVSAVEDILVNVNPEPVGTPTTVAAVCSDELFSLVLDAFVPNLAGNSYSWLVNYNGLSGTGPGAGNIIAESITNPTGGTVNVVYTVTPTSSGGTCPGSTFDLTVPINPEPRLDPGLSPLPVCSDVASGIILAVDPGGIPSVPAASYNIVGITWDPALIPAGGNASIGNSQPANALALDSYTNTSNVQKLASYDVVPVSVDNCQGDLLTIVFTINPAPAISNSLDRIVCIDQASGIILATDGVSTPAQDYEVQSVLAPGLTPGGGNVLLPVTSNNTLVINGDMYTNPTDNPLTAVYTIVPISAAGCRGPVKDVTLTVEPTITAVANNTLPTICSNSSADITLTSPTVPTAGNIVFNITAVASSPFVSGFIPILNFLPQGYVIADFLVNTGNTPETVTYTITPVASGGASGNGCSGASIIEVVTIDPLPLVTPGQFDMVCSNTATNYTITTLNNLVGTTFTWLAPTLSDPGLTGGSARGVASSAPITDTFINSTSMRQTATYNITPIGPTGCVGSVMQLIIFVDPLPIGAISVDQPVVCMNGSALLGFAMTVGVAPFEIVYSDGITDFTVSNIANSHFIAKNNLTATTTYELKSILDVNGCLQNLVGETVTVTVENPISDFTADITNDCTPLLVTFTNNNIQVGTQYEWNWGDGSPIEIDNSPTITHTFINNSTVSDISFNVLLTAQRTNGAVVCTDLSSEFITIKATVNLNVTPSTTEGCSPLVVSFINNSQGVLANTWFWREQGTMDQNDLTNISSASFVISNPSTTTKIYEVVYQGDRNGCSDELITEITVHPELVADYTVAPSTVVSITNPTITVTNNTLNKASWNHVWDWGDGSPTTNAVDPGPHTYGTFGTFVLSLVITDPSGFCTSTKLETITVEPVLPIVDFEVDFTEGCRPFTVTFTNLSTSVDPATYLWEFRNALGTLVGTSNLENPSFTFFDAGVINVSLSGSNPLGITDTETKLALIEIYDIPIASFTVTPETVFLPDQLLFTSNLSVLADSFEWDFNGDGDSDSEEFEPQYKYESAGVYNIGLIAINTATTCRDTLLIEKAVKVVEAGVADIPNGFFPESGGSNPGGPGGSAGGPNSSFLPRLKGVRDDGFEMQIFDRWGHLIFESKDKNVGWNGRDANGKVYPVGVYVYKVDVIYVSGQQTTILGDVTLIR